MAQRDSAWPGIPGSVSLIVCNLMTFITLPPKDSNLEPRP